MFLEEPEIYKFFKNYRQRRYRHKEIIIRAEDEPRNVYYIDKGFVRQYYLTYEGNELTLHLFRPGSFFPLIWTIARRPNRYYYQALGKLEVYVGPQEDFLNFMKTDPLLLYRLVQRLLNGLAGLLTRLEYLSFGNSYQRVIAILLYLAKHFGKKRKNQATLLTSKFTHAEIASFAALARETTSAVMAKLTKKRLISYEKRLIKINDLGRLELELSGPLHPPE